MKFPLPAWLTGCLLALSAAPSPAETFTWTGNGDGVSWNDSANWSQGAVPDSTQANVVVQGDAPFGGNLQMSLDSGLTIGKLDMTLPGAGGPAPVLGSSNGSVLTVQAHSGSDQPRISVASSGAYQTFTINTGIEAPNPDGNYILELEAQGGALVINGNITQGSSPENSYNVSTDETGAVYLNGDNSGLKYWSFLQNGNLYIGHDKALGGSSFIIQSNNRSSRLIATDNLTVDNLIEFTSKNHASVLGVQSRLRLEFTHNFTTNATNNDGSPYTAAIAVEGNSDGITDTGTVALTKSDLDLAPNIDFLLQSTAAGGGLDATEATLEFSSSSNGNQKVGGNILGEGTVLKTGSGATRLVNVAHSGNLSVNAGTLTVNTLAMGDTREVQLNDGMLNLQNVASPHTFHFNGGTLNFEDALTYSGSLNVTAGTLLISAVVQVGGTLTLAEGGTLGGSGNLMLTGGNAMAAEGTFAPGDSIGMLALSATSGATDFNLDLSSASFAFELGADGNADQLYSSSLVFDLGDEFAISQFAFTTLDGFAPGNTYDLFFSEGDGITGTITEATGYVGGYLASIELTQDGFDDVLRLTISNTPIPEPATGALLLAGLGACLYRRRRA